MAPFDRPAIAERLRVLIGISSHADLEQLAQRLGVDEPSLRLSVDEDSPHPTVEVLAAVIREFGVDPTWLITGVYDAGTHRSAMESDDSTLSTLRRFLDNHRGPISELPAESFRRDNQN